jgi:hypothetical protein
MEKGGGENPSIVVQPVERCFFFKNLLAETKTRK